MSAPTPSPERRWVHDGLFSLSACTPDNPCTADGVLCGYSDELVQLTVVGVEQIPPTPAPSPDPRSPEDGAVERGERSEHERWFVIHVNQISALRFAEFPVERLARASVAACNCGPHQIRKTTTVTYTDHGELELVPATPANRATR